MLPCLIYKDLLHGSESIQRASLSVLPTGHSHEADSISEVHLAPHSNGDLLPNGAGARSGEEGQSLLWELFLAVVGCMLTKNGMCHTSRLTCVVRSSETTPQSAAQEQHDAAADHHKRRKDHRQAHSVASIYVVWLNLCTEQNGIAEECIFLGDLSNSKKYRGTN